MVSTICKGLIYALFFKCGKDKALTAILDYEIKVSFALKFITLSTLFYNIFLRLYSAGIKLAGFWNPKAKLWVKGRKELFDRLNMALPTLSSGPTIWMHCASLGEFEQGRPLLENIRANYSQYKIILTFFSPSGYEIVKKDHKAFADLVVYMPTDSAANAKKFITLVKPSLVLWVKYEFWYYHLAELKRQGIAVLFVSALFRKEQPFFKWYGGLWRKMLGSFTHFFVQNDESKVLLRTINITNNVTVTGDTRFDRVISIADKFEPLPLIEKFCAESKVIVAGSTWEDDEAELTHYAKLHPEIKFIIAPHEIDEENLQNLQKEFPRSLFYSQLVSCEYEIQNLQPPNCLIINNIGMLSRLYAYADITYVGGGFGDGIHNVLEAAVYGKPVIHGPEYKKYFEAVELVESSAGICINNALELEKILDELLNNREELTKRGNAAKEYVYSKAGSTNKILNYIYENRLLTR